MSKFLVICCDDSSVWSPVSFGEMFSTKLSLEGDEWFHINIARGDEIPSIDGFKGIVITGSRHNVRDQLPWFQPLVEMIRNVAAKGEIKMYGGCFGCQIIGHALGGQVDRNPSERFVLKAEILNIINSDALSNICCDNDLCCDCCCKGLRLIESHGDCVRSLPPDATIIASSASCANEMFVAGRINNILCCQAHPEFELSYCVTERIFPSVCKSGRLNDAEREDTLKSFEEFDNKDSMKLLKIISMFLHS